MTRIGVLIDVKKFPRDGKDKAKDENNTKKVGDNFELCNRYS